MPRWGNRSHAWYGILAGSEFRNGIPPEQERAKANATRHPPCRTLSDMSEIEILAIEEEYGAEVIRPI